MPLPLTTLPPILHVTEASFPRVFQTQKEHIREHPTVTKPHMLQHIFLQASQFWFLILIVPLLLLKTWHCWKYDKIRTQKFNFIDSWMHVPSNSIFKLYLTNYLEGFGDRTSTYLHSDKGNFPQTWCSLESVLILNSHDFPCFIFMRWNVCS